MADTMGSLWREATSPDGKTYYYHINSKETRWEKPEDFDNPPQYEQAQIDAAWQETKAEDGRRYFFNALTRETNWKRPPAMDRQQPPRPAQQFVPANDNYNPAPDRRDRRADRDHGLPQKPNFEGGRGGGMPWEQRQENTGFRGPMPAKTDEPEYSSPAEAKEAFFKLLRSYKVSPDTTWEDALRLVVRDREYRAIKDPKQRKEAFEDYQQEVRAQEKGKEKERRERLREDFRKMLGTHEEIKHYTRWKTARPIIEREAVFKSAGDEEERRQMFEEYIIALKKQHMEDEAAKRKSAMEDVEAMVQALITNPDHLWEDAEDLIMKENERFKSEEKFRVVSKADVLAAFDSRIKALERAANDAKQKEKRMKVRGERQARDAFRQLLRELHKDGKIRAGTKWQDTQPLIADDERYLNMLGNPGSSPLDLFWDVVEEEDTKIRYLRNYALDVLEDKRYEMTIETTPAEFAEVMRSDQRTSGMNDEEMTMVYGRLMDKIKKRLDDDRAHSERYQRKAIDSLRSVIKHLDPPVRVGDKYEDVLSRLQSFDEFKSLPDEEARRSAFDKHIRRLKEKEDDIERERPRRERDRDHRNGSRRRGGDRDERDRGERSRRHRTRTPSPEYDAYKADRQKAQADRERQYRKPSFGLTPPPRDSRRDDRDDRYRARHDRHESMSHYDRERREREMERERSYITRADPRDKQRTAIDYGDEDGGPSSRPGSIRKRRDSDNSAAGSSRRDPKRLRRSVDDNRNNRSTPDRPLTRYESPVKTPPALQSGSEEGEIEEI